MCGSCALEPKTRISPTGISSSPFSKRFGGIEKLQQRHLALAVAHPRDPKQIVDFTQELVANHGDALEEGRIRRERPPHVVLDQTPGEVDTSERATRTGLGSLEVPFPTVERGKRNVHSKEKAIKSIGLPLVASHQRHIRPREGREITEWKRWPRPSAPERLRDAAPNYSPRTSVAPARV